MHFLAILWTDGKGRQQLLTAGEERVWSRKDDGKHLSFSDDKFVLSNAAHADHGLYCCVLISSVATVSRDVQLIVDETVPQCATKVRVQCEGRQRFAAHWVPGYPGGNHSQTFRIFYQKMHDGSNDEAKEEWEVTALTDQSKIHLDRLELFGEYEFKLEASNRFGAINCTVPGTHYSPTADNRLMIDKSSKLRHNRQNHRKIGSKNGEIGAQSEESSSSRFGSTSTAASDVDSTVTPEDGTGNTEEGSAAVDSAVTSEDQADSKTTDQAGGSIGRKL
uniref:Ig-like domain-containing protein n=1 Tax=Globodera pallida TaxID=36090 RepID=A0A183BY48_GLOPA